MIQNPTCGRCGKHPSEIEEYVEASAWAGLDPATYVVREDGTYNPKTNRFYCTDCYVEVGMPLGVCP